MLNSEVSYQRILFICTSKQNQPSRLAAQLTGCSELLGSSVSALYRSDLTPIFFFSHHIFLLYFFFREYHRRHSSCRQEMSWTCGSTSLPPTAFGQSPASPAVHLLSFLYSNPPSLRFLSSSPLTTLVSPRGALPRTIFGTLVTPPRRSVPWYSTPKIKQNVRREPTV